MRRTSISPEFKYTKVNGTFNMIEERNFFGSKMMDIEDYIEINDSDIIYYQSNSFEQINLISEQLLPPVIYSPIIDKKDNHTLSFNIDQSDFDKLNLSKWILEIDIETVLRNYIFANIKNVRTFENILNNETKENNINSAITNYIDSNIMDRYMFDKIDLYLSYIDLNLPSNLQMDVSNIDKSNYDSSIEVLSNLESKLSTDLSYDNKKLRVDFKQGKKRSEYNFNYYFNLKFKKI